MNEEIKLSGKLFPSTNTIKTTDFIEQPETPGNVGICFSGGGSVAMISALGQMRALHTLGLLGKVRAISTVSGGSWAMVPFIYLPKTIDDEVFLGPLRKTLSGITWEELEEMEDNYLGKIVANEEMNYEKIALSLIERIVTDFPDNKIWTYIIAKNILEPYGLAKMTEDGVEQSWFTFSEERAGKIIAANPDLPSTYYTYKKNGIPRPFHLCNTAMFVDINDERFLAPVQCSAIGTGIFASNIGYPIGFVNKGKQLAGGGLVESFAFNSKLNRVLEPNTFIAKQDVNAPFSLADITANSSAFYGIAFPKAIGAIKSIDPTYSYWPVGSKQKILEEGFETKFTDGGATDNNGLLNLLVYEDIESAVVFTNALQPVYRADNSSVKAPFNIVVDQWLPPYFGYTPYITTEEYNKIKEKGNLKVGYNKYNNLSADTIKALNIHYFSNNQVFATELFEEVLNDFAEVVDEGWNISTPPVIYRENWEILSNKWYNIKGGRILKKLIIFHYGPMQGWDDATHLNLSEEVKGNLEKYVNKCHHGKTKKGVNETSIPKPASYFPNFNLIDTQMPPAIVNLFADFTAQATILQKEKLFKIFSSSE